MIRLAPRKRGEGRLLGLVLKLAGNALLFPTTGAAGVASLTLVALFGAALSRVGPSLEGKLPIWFGPRARLVGVDLLIALVVCAASVRLFAKSWNVAGYRIYDWGP